MFLLVLAHSGSPRPRAIKRLLFITHIITMCTVQLWSCSVISYACILCYAVTCQGGSEQQCQVERQLVFMKLLNSGMVSRRSIMRKVLCISHIVLKCIVLFILSEVFYCRIFSLLNLGTTVASLGSNCTNPA